MSLKKWLLLAVMLVPTVGCGGGDTVLPTDEFTDEQNAAIQAEDDAIADEESTGGM